MWPRGDSVDVEQRGRQMKEGDMPDSAREAKAAVRFALGDDTRQEDADAMAERLQQPADLMSDEQPSPRSDSLSWKLGGAMATIQKRTPILKRCRQPC